MTQVPPPYFAVGDSLSDTEPENRYCRVLDFRVYFPYQI